MDESEFSGYIHQNSSQSNQNSGWYNIFGKKSIRIFIFTRIIIEFQLSQLEWQQKFNQKILIRPFSSELLFNSTRLYYFSRRSFCEPSRSIEFGITLSVVFNLDYLIHSRGCHVMFNNSLSLPFQTGKFIIYLIEKVKIPR